MQLAPRMCTVIAFQDNLSQEDKGVLLAIV